MYSRCNHQELLAFFAYLVSHWCPAAGWKVSLPDFLAGLDIEGAEGAINQRESAVSFSAWESSHCTLLSAVQKYVRQRLWGRSPLTNFALKEH